MSTMFVLMCLLLLSYIGSLLVGGRAVRGFGLPSGSEYLVLGIVLGPLVFDVIRRNTLVTFTPIALVCIGWLALAVGLDYAWVGGRRVHLPAMLLGIGSGIFHGAVVFGATWLVLPWCVTLPASERLLLAGGLGAACAETTRLAIRWVFERYRATGPVSATLGDLTHTDDVVAVLALAVLFAYHGTTTTRWWPSGSGLLAVTLGLGVGLGLITVVLLGKEFRLLESWSTLIGTSLMATGLAARLGLPGLSVLFMLGATIAVASRHHAEIDAMVSSTERSVLLPALVLAGASIDPNAAGRALWIAPVAVLVRFGAKTLSGLWLRSWLSPLREAPPLLGLGLVSSGGTSVALGYSFQLAFPGVVGDTVLLTAALSAVAGELVGPATLRYCLRQAGEIPIDEPSAGARHDDTGAASDPPDVDAQDERTDGEAT